LLIAATITALVVAQYSGPQIIAGQKLPDKSVFPADDVWNRDVSKDPLDPQSAIYIATMGQTKPLHPDFGSFYQGAPMGIPYIVVGKDQPKVKVAFEYGDESDAWPYPIPPDAPIEGGANAPADSDRHVLVVDRDNWMLYEIFAAKLTNGAWSAGSGAIWDLKKPSYGQRQKGWTSADGGPADLPRPGALRGNCRGQDHPCDPRDDAQDAADICLSRDALCQPIGRSQAAADGVASAAQAIV